MEHDPKEKIIHRDDKKETEEIGGLFGGIKKIIRWVKKAIGRIIGKIRKTPHHTEEKHAHLSPDLLSNLQSHTKKILDDISALLKHDTIKDETDKKLVLEASAFIENPSENLPDLMRHTTNIGQVLGGYEMQGEEAPPEIDAMHGYLLALQCINRIHFVEEKLNQGSPDFPKIQEAMAQALDWANILAKGYKNHTLLDAVNELQGRLNKK